MKNGQYAICLSADGYSGSGRLALTGRNGAGRDHRYQIELQLLDEGPRCAGIVNIQMDPAVVHNRSMPRHYSLSMSGNSVDDTFDLIGIGPLGLIITLTGKRVAPLATVEGG
jgi:hypothetical protein